MIYNIFKEKNWTSFDVVAKLRGVLRVKKIGHAGTLDPLAEGVLVILTDQDTKKQAEIMKLEKEYLADIAFGAATKTYDLEQLPVYSENQRSVLQLERELQRLLPGYTGELDQVAPPYSAKKVRGKPLYKKARAGQVKEEDLPVKRITISRFEVQNLAEKSFETDKGLKALPVLTCKIVCSSGTYVRSIAHDLGGDLGTGGVLVNLVRTRVGPYTIENSQKIRDLAGV